MDPNALGRAVARTATTVLLAGALSASLVAAAPAALAAGGAHAPRHRARAASVTCPYATLIPTSANVPHIEAATLCLVNRERALHHERPLRNDADLADSATRHSQDMVAANYFDHTGPTGETPLDRIRASGYLPRGATAEVGENIDLGTLWLATPAAVVADWMNSPGHRANILNSDYVDSGIGVVAQAPAQYGGGEAGATYTQDFGAVMAPDGTLY